MYFIPLTKMRTKKSRAAVTHVKSVVTTVETISNNCYNQNIKMQIINNISLHNKSNLEGEISGSPENENQDGCLLGCYAV
jgi:hypothetical protein